MTIAYRVMNAEGDIGAFDHTGTPLPPGTDTGRLIIIHPGIATVGAGDRAAAIDHDGADLADLIRTAHAAIEAEPAYVESDGIADAMRGIHDTGYDLSSLDYPEDDNDTRLAEDYLEAARDAVQTITDFADELEELLRPTRYHIIRVPADRTDVFDPAGKVLPSKLNQFDLGIFGAIGRPLPAETNADREIISTHGSAVVRAGRKTFIIPDAGGALIDLIHAAREAVATGTPD